MSSHAQSVSHMWIKLSGVLGNLFLSHGTESFLTQSFPSYGKCKFSWLHLNTSTNVWKSKITHNFTYSGQKRPFHSTNPQLFQFHQSVPSEHYQSEFHAALRSFPFPHCSSIFFFSVFLFCFVLFFVICDSGKKTHMLVAVKRSIIEYFQYYIAITKFNGVLMSRWM